jgi:hypothetical protein
MIRAHDSGFRLREIEIEYHARELGVATSGHPRVILNSVQDMVRFWLTYQWRKAGAIHIRRGEIKTGKGRARASDVPNERTLDR